jgi:nitrogen-specific signal transduction histidine kinase
MSYQRKMFIALQHEHRLLGIILLSLHLILWYGFDAILIRLLLIFHLVAFILWQPLWERRASLSVKNIIIILILGLSFVIIGLNLWLMTIWQLLLLAILGGRDLTNPLDRAVNLLSMVFICVQLFIINIPSLFIFANLAHTQLSLQEFIWLNYGLLGLAATLLFIRAENNLEHRYSIDFIHGLIVSLLLIIIILGSLNIMHYKNISYPMAIFQMAFFSSIFLFVISWLWVTIEDNASMDELWTRHLLNIGNSIEIWLENLAQPRNYKELDATEYLESALEQLVSLPWIQGIAWESTYGKKNSIGEEQKHQLLIDTKSLRVKVYSRYKVSTNHTILIRLLIHLIEHFYQAKRREEAFAQQVRLQATYETGAKLTHDIKNLLQSLHAISSVIENSSNMEKFGETQRIVQGQMPHLTLRLKTLLDKLKKPQKTPYTQIPLTLWWENLKARYARRDIVFMEKINHNLSLVPEDAFDNAVENLLQNALSKRRHETNLHITVDLYVDKDKLNILICDDGTAIPEHIASNLMEQPVTSRSGFGIGLYQLAKNLTGSGYKVDLCSNVDGEVCFALSNYEQDS